MLNILGLIVVGLIIGVLARLALPSRQRIGLWLTLALGVAGALIGGLIASAIGTGDIFELNVIGFIVAVIAAAILISVVDRGSASRGGAAPRH